MKQFFNTIVLILLTVCCYSQQKLKPIGCDCKKAILLKINGKLTYGKTVPPSGFGDIQEIGRHKKVFEKEHNSAWYLLTLQRDGELVFDISPEDTTNDYDFLLYAYQDSSFCDLVKHNKFLPVRANMSNNIKAKGRTGIQSSEKLKDLIGEGPGNNYSNSLSVKKGEKYMLVLDNVTPNGKGHTIEFGFMRDVQIKGTVTNSDSVPISADIILTDVKGTTVLETKSDEKGEYHIEISLVENQNYTLTYVGLNEFVETVLINTKSLKEYSSFPPIKTVLPKLRKGEKYKLGKINFFGDVDVLLPESKPSVESLGKLMEKNKQLTIQIEGHVNHPKLRENDTTRATFDQTLSEKRALTIYNYLIKHGISPNRMSYIGLSNKFPLYKKPTSESQEQANRRVEIKVVSFE